MKQTKGTAKTLDEAIINGMCIGQIKDIPDSLYWFIKDFLAQRFGAAMLKPGANDEILLKLFKDITRRENGKQDTNEDRK